jgi:hypothetical protein
MLLLLQISHQWEKDHIVITIHEAYTWSFVTQLFHNGYPNNGGDVKLSKKYLQLNQYEPVFL